jgi:hypothetical protein
MYRGVIQRRPRGDVGRQPGAGRAQRPVSFYMDEGVVLQAELNMRNAARPVNPLIAARGETQPSIPVVTLPPQ